MSGSGSDENGIHVKAGTTGPGVMRRSRYYTAILLTSAALSGLLAAAVTMRNPHRPDGETRATARALRSAIKRSIKPPGRSPAREVTAQLLDLTD